MSSFPAVVLTGVAAVVSVIATQAWLRQRERDDEPRPRNSWARGSRVVALFGGSAAGKTYVVTGATSGLGLEAARLLLSAGGKVIFAVRDLACGERKAKEMLAAAVVPGATAEVMLLDLADLESVRTFATAFLATGRRWDGLLNNAGVFCTEGQTCNGFQVTWQTNCLGPALLTELLLPAATEDARIVNVSRW